MKELVEKMILESFKKEPFHNLYFKYNIIPQTHELGGTCSDKVMSFYRQLCDIGISATLHSSFINEKETHRLVKVQIDEVVYFADVGNGWPSIKMFPLSENYEYNCYGITFKSIITDETMDIFQKKGGVEFLSVSIPLQSKTEDKILNDIKNRFCQSIEYPFRDKIRFTQIIGDYFYFLKDETLTVYENNKDSFSITGLSENSLVQTLESYFNFDLNKFIIKNKNNGNGL